MARHVRHINASPNEYIAVHRNGGGGGSGGGGAGCFLLILLVFCWKLIVMTALLMFAAWAAYKFTNFLNAEFGWQVAWLFWGCIGIMVCLVAWPVVVGSILAGCGWLALSVWIVRSKGWRVCMWGQLGLFTALSFIVYPVHTLLIVPVLACIYWKRGDLRCLTLKQVHRLRLHLEQRASSNQSTP